MFLYTHYLIVRPYLSFFTVGECFMVKMFLIHMVHYWAHKTQKENVKITGPRLFWSFKTAKKH